MLCCATQILIQALLFMRGFCKEDVRALTCEGVVASTPLVLSLCLAPDAHPLPAEPEKKAGAQSGRLQESTSPCCRLSLPEGTGLHRTSAQTGGNHIGIQLHRINAALKRAIRTGLCLVFWSAPPPETVDWCNAVRPMRSFTFISANLGCGIISKQRKALSCDAAPRRPPARLGWRLWRASQVFRPC